MKKVSTVVVPQIRNFSPQKLTTEKLTIGLDLGDRSSWYCGCCWNSAWAQLQRP
jgi:hypothetical protein